MFKLFRKEKSVFVNVFHSFSEIVQSIGSKHKKAAINCENGCNNSKFVKQEENN